LILGSYVRSPPFTVETLLVFLQAEQLRIDGGGFETSLLMGMIVKLAMRMGYHKDASHFPQISVLDGEMQRRVWAVIIQLDALIAIQDGLPRMIGASHYDTAQPSNLLDGDFHEGDNILPVARSATIQTPAQYVVVKNKMLAIYGMVVDLMSSSTLPSYNEIMTADMSLHNAYASIPECFRVRPFSEDFIGLEDTTIRRIYIALIFEEAKCVLHQRFLNLARGDNRYAYSRAACVEASLKILQYQHLLEVETQPGGRLFQTRWRISDTARNSFLLATSVLCYEIDLGLGDGQGADIPRRGRIIKALEQAHQIWTQTESRSSSFDAAKAAEVISIVLKKARSSLTDIGTYSLIFKEEIVHAPFCA
jgi:hypothetical protein